MEHCLRATTCLMLIFGLLYANPILREDAHLAYELLQYLPRIKEVTCGRNMTFTSPTNVQDHCCASAFTFIMEQLDQAQRNCVDNDKIINSTLPTLEQYSNFTCPQSVQSSSSDCKWESKEDPKTIAQFVDNIKRLMMRFNSQKH